MAESEVDTLQNQILELENQITTIKLEYEEKIGIMDLNFQEERDELEQQISDLTDRLDGLTTERRSHVFEEEKMESLVQMISQKEIDINGLKELHNKEIEQKNDVIRNLEYKNQTLQEKLSELEKSMNSEKVRLEEEMKKQTEKLEQLESSQKSEKTIKKKGTFRSFFGKKKKKKDASPTPDAKKGGKKPPSGLSYLFRSMNEERFTHIPAINRRVEVWSLDDTLEWLKEIGLLQELGGQFRNKNITGANLFEDVKEITLNQLVPSDRIIFRTNLQFLRKQRKIQKEFARKLTMIMNMFDDFFDSKENVDVLNIEELEMFIACCTIEDRCRLLLEGTKRIFFESNAENRGKLPCHIVMIPADRVKSENFGQLYRPQFNAQTEVEAERYTLALRVGPWIFEWNTMQCICPKVLNESSDGSYGGGLLSIPVDEVDVFSQVPDLEVKIVVTLMKYNRIRNYHPKKCNAAHFIEEFYNNVTGKKGPKFSSKSISQIMKHVRKNGFTQALPLELIPISSWGIGEIGQWMKVIGLEDRLKKRTVPFSTGKEILSFDLEDGQSEGVLDQVFPIPEVPPEAMVEEGPGQPNPLILERDQMLLTRKLFKVNIFHLQQMFNVYGRKTFDRSFSSVCFKIFSHERSIPMKYDAVEFFVHCLSDKEHLCKHYLQKKLDQSAYLSKVGKKEEKSETEGEDDDDDDLFDDEDLEDLEAKDLFELITMGGYKKQPVLRVKIIITEIAFSKGEKWLRSMLSPIMTKVPVSVNSDFGLFHTALLLGPFYLEWTKREVIIPKRISSSNALLSFDVDPVELISLERFTEVIEKIGEVVVKWNTKFKYTKSRGQNQGNCQDFIDDLSQELGINLRVQKESVFGNFIEEMRTKGNAQIFFQPRADFVEKFELDKIEKFSKYRTSDGKYKVLFETHEELDEFVHTLITESVMKFQENFAQGFESEYKLLKAFDRAFWLRYLKSDKKEYAPSMKRLMYGATRKCGCPFSDPRDTFSYV